MFKIAQRLMYHRTTNYILTYLLHGAESFLRSWPVFAASQEIPRFMKPEGSSPHSQVPATRPYPELTPSRPHDSLQLSEGPSQYYPPTYVWVSPMASFPPVSPPTPCAPLSPPPYAPHAPPISFFSRLTLHTKSLHFHQLVQKHFV